ncbi:hypothetical protein [Microbacterium sp. IEGM 1404]|uniref:hypothetical protein n=1 Tax=Microbacterium sp. IEGM 1404 TaxID=3047084 RepID=UPI0024B7D103|nr:hypothetical protein [Microbacterium sp. IEGM 1404]MDI9890569.1 hypothetical protein [Microbacterium sp. IEGM 1404]
MMDAARALAERVNAHDAAVESVGWAWASRLRKAAEECESVEAVTLADAVEAVLMAEGADGLVDLTLVGPALGGLGRNDVAPLLRMVDEQLAGHAVAA